MPKAPEAQRRGGGDVGWGVVPLNSALSRKTPYVQYICGHLWTPAALDFRTFILYHNVRRSAMILTLIPTANRRLPERAPLPMGEG